MGPPLLPLLFENGCPPPAAGLGVAGASGSPPAGELRSPYDTPLPAPSAGGAAPRCEERPSGGNLALGRVTFRARRAGMRGRAIVVARCPPASGMTTSTPRDHGQVVGLPNRCKVQAIRGF